MVSLEADGPEEPLFEIRGVEVVHTNPPLPGCGVHEFVVPDVDPDMTDRSPGIEEEEVAFGQIIPVDPQPHMGLFKSRSGKFDIEELIDFFDEAGAVDPGHRRASQTVRGAQEAQRDLDQQLRLFRVVPSAEQVALFRFAFFDFRPCLLRGEKGVHLFLLQLRPGLHFGFCVCGRFRRRYRLLRVFTQNKFLSNFQCASLHPVQFAKPGDGNPGLSGDTEERVPLLHDIFFCPNNRRWIRFYGFMDWFGGDDENLPYLEPVALQAVCRLQRTDGGARLRGDSGQGIAALDDIGFVRDGTSAKNHECEQDADSHPEEHMPFHHEGPPHWFPGASSRLPRCTDSSTKL